MKIRHLNGQWKSKEVAKLQCKKELIRGEIQSNLDRRNMQERKQNRPDSEGGEEVIRVKPRDPLV